MGSSEYNVVSFCQNGYMSRRQAHGAHPLRSYTARTTAYDSATSRGDVGGHVDTEPVAIESDGAADDSAPVTAPPWEEGRAA
jgi:hypothetical protein